MSVYSETDKTEIRTLQRVDWSCLATLKTFKSPLKSPFGHKRDPKMPPRRRTKATNTNDAEETGPGASGRDIDDTKLQARQTSIKTSGSPGDVEMADVGDRKHVAGSPADGGADTRGDPGETFDTDLVTQLQTDLALVCEHLFVGIGSLQRDARPVPLEDEEIVGGGGANSNKRGGAGAWNGGGPTNNTGAPRPDLDHTVREVGDIESMATRMGAELAESLRRLERHIQMLPDDIVYDTSKQRGGKGVERAEVIALLEENRALREKLEGVVRVRTEEVKELEERHRRAVEGVLLSRDGARSIGRVDTGG